MSNNSFFLDLSTKDEHIVKQLLAEAPVSLREFAIADEASSAIVYFINAQNMPCPAPLLKTKVALKSLNATQTIYMVASDKNTLNDVTAFCQHAGHTLQSWQNSHADTQLHHFLITKNI